MSCGPGNHYKATPVCQDCGVNVVEERANAPKTIHWAIVELNAGAHVRRKTWLPGTALVIVGDSLIRGNGATPDVPQRGLLWTPLPEDFTATDWEYVPHPGRLDE